MTARQRRVKHAAGLTAYIAVRNGPIPGHGHGRHYLGLLAALDISHGQA